MWTIRTLRVILALTFNSVDLEKHHLLIPYVYFQEVDELLSVEVFEILIDQISYCSLVDCDNSPGDWNLKTSTSAPSRRASPLQLFAYLIIMWTIRTVKVILVLTFIMCRSWSASLDCSLVEYDNSPSDWTWTVNMTSFNDYFLSPLYPLESCNSVKIDILNVNRLPSINIPTILTNSENLMQWFSHCSLLEWTANDYHQIGDMIRRKEFLDCFRIFLLN